MTSKEALYDLTELVNDENDYFNKALDLRDVIEKDLEILEIIKNKRIDMELLIKVVIFNDYRIYNFELGNSTRELTETEFNLIKEWLKR